MELRDKEGFKRFLALPEHERLKELLGLKKFPWYQKLYLWYLNKWWSRMRRWAASPKDPYNLWESLYKGRF